MPVIALWLTCIRRLLRGIGCDSRIGAEASVVSISISEIAPQQIRATLVMSWQLFDTFGTFISSAANYIIFNLNQDSLNLRFIIALPFIPALIFLLLILFWSEPSQQEPPQQGPAHQGASAQVPSQQELSLKKLGWFQQVKLLFSQINILAFLSSAMFAKMVAAGAETSEYSGQRKNDTHISFYI
ncbi:hypothetical protein K469DRAFT_691634 [Zopfia rhizophila CBS 207.26]|uniref:Major facilitator superfamily (MFS) profile domain-containing protein n=1 Tax=Zopfia rhizophila CBS 207.26 TaxID=1314779 RepID=A0A6A6DWF6_9PEZI|nr:hypothetical protein K469DRAFT_691634 [Zopfia rhizophila CBS 207.26]